LCSAEFYRDDDRDLGSITPMAWRAEGGLPGSSKGVRDVVPNRNACRQTSSRTKLILGSPVRGSPLALPEAKPLKITPNREVRD